MPYFINIFMYLLNSGKGNYDTFSDMQLKLGSVPHSNAFLNTQFLYDPYPESIF